MFVMLLSAEARRKFRQMFAHKHRMHSCDICRKYEQEWTNWLETSLLCSIFDDQDEEFHD